MKSIINEPVWILLILITHVVIISLSGRRMMVKANKRSWPALIPGYNILLFLDIIKKSRYWLLLLLIPVANIVIVLIIMVELARAFGKDTIYGFGLFFLPLLFFPLLGFGRSEYKYR